LRGTYLHIKIKLCRMTTIWLVLIGVAWCRATQFNCLCKQTAAFYRSYSPQEVQSPVLKKLRCNFA
jgi:hypothetical protein